MQRLRSLVTRTVFGLVETLLTNFVGPAGNWARSVYWRARMKHVGAHVTIGLGVRISNPQWISLGENCWIDDGVTLLAGPPAPGRANVSRKPNAGFRYAEGELVIGRNVHVAQGVVLQAHGGLEVGEDSGIASGSCVYTLSHHYRMPGERGTAPVLYKFSPRAPSDEQSLIAAPVVIAHSSAVGLNSVVLPGVTIGPGSWVAAQSLVSRDVPPFTLAGGNPAAVIKSISGVS